MANYVSMYTHITQPNLNQRIHGKIKIFFPKKLKFVYLTHKLCCQKHRNSVNFEKKKKQIE